MNKPDSSAPQLQRRHLLRLAGSAVLLPPAMELLSRARGAEPSQGKPQPPGAQWATGGSARLAEAVFPDPFGDHLLGACQLTCEATIGPCHTVSAERQDVSDGWDGLPLRLSLRVVDASCRPVPDALVEIWHTNYTGGYSGQIQRMCNNNPEDVARNFFRGYQRPDARGRVSFNSCYPGWYRGRAVHIHLRVLTGEYGVDHRASTSVTTQLLFSDALNREIFTTHPLYSPFGLPDTPLDTDNARAGRVPGSRCFRRTRRTRGPDGRGGGRGGPRGRGGSVPRS